MTDEIRAQDDIVMKVFMLKIEPVITEFATTAHNINKNKGFIVIVTKSTLDDALKNSAQYMCKYHQPSEWATILNSAGDFPEVPELTSDRLNIITMFGDKFALFDMQADKNFIDEAYRPAAFIAFEA